MTQVNINISVTGYFCNAWPDLEIWHGPEKLFDGQVQGDRDYNFDVCFETNSLLTLRHKNKYFGENGRFDTSDNQDRYLRLQDIKFDEVSIGQEMISRMIFHTQWSEMQANTHAQEYLKQYQSFACDGILAFNGHASLEFEAPIYNWLIMQKYKISNKPQLSFYSQYTENWHYEKDIELIKEIKELMRLD